MNRPQRQTRTTRTILTAALLPRVRCRRSRWKHAWGLTPWAIAGVMLMAGSAEAAVVTGDGESRALQGLDVGRANRTEVLHVTSQQGRVTVEGGCGNQGIGNRDGMLAAQLRGQPSDPRGDRHPRQQLQQLKDLSLIARGQHRTRQQLALRNDRDRRAGAAAFDISQQLIGGQVAPQMVDQNVGVDQVLGQLRGLALESALPLMAKPALIRAALRQAPSQQAGRLSHDAPRRGGCDAADHLRRPHCPFDCLQLIFQAFNLFNHVDGFHHADLLIRSLA